MEETWAKGSVGGVDLHLDLSGTRVRAGLEGALRDAIRADRLRPGTRLPSSRALAADLGIARNTVAEVYSQLVAEGWLTARTGSGTAVAPHRTPAPGTPVTARPEQAVPRYDLRAGVPDLSAFPRRAWLATARKVLASAPDHLLGYPDPRGAARLRAALAGYLARARGVTADPAHIVICAGFAHGLAVISRALRAAGAATLAVEAYGHQTHRDIAAGQGLRLRPLPVDGMGAVIGRATGADAVLLTPAHQFPLGVTLHPRRRREAADWGGVVIEDDYDGEFRYDRQPVGALQTLAPDHVIYAGTASKSLAPSLRLGWLVVPPRLLDAVTAELAAGPSVIDQLTLAEFITSGGYDRQIRRARLAYRRRRDRLAAALRGKGLRVTGIAAGMHAVLELPRTSLEHAVLSRASEHGLAIDGLGHYRAGAPGPDDGVRAGLVIGYGRPPEHAYTTALARLCAVLPPDLLPVSYRARNHEPCYVALRVQGVRPGTRGAHAGPASREGEEVRNLMTARRRLLSVAASAGLLATCGLLLSAGPAQAGPGGPAQAGLTPGPAEWWLAGWQVQRKVWPLAEGAGVTVAEVESGVQATIADLRDVVLPGANLTGTGGNGDTDIQVGEDGHGTAMAVVVAGQGTGTGTVGIAPRARILPVIVGGSGPASARTAAAGIRYAVSHGAQVIDLPFGIGRTSAAACDPVLQAAVAYALGHDVVLVASSGNASLYAGPDEPASCAGVLAVGGTEPDGSLWPGSTREPYVAVAAPGDHMVYVGRDGRYTTTGAGTSFSAALTAGTAALIRSRYPDMPWYQVDQRLTSTATPAGRAVPNHGYGYGIINPARAVNASAYPVPAAAPNPVYAKFTRWLATPAGRAAAARYGLGARDPVTPAARPARGDSARMPSITMREIVITVVAAVCAFVVALVFVLRMSARRRRLAAMATPPHPRSRRRWDERSWSFGPDEGGDYGGSPGYGRPPGYGPPPLWTEPPYDPPWR